MSETILGFVWACIGVLAGYGVCLWRYAKYTNVASVIKIKYESEIKAYEHGIKDGIKIAEKYQLEH